MIALLRKNIQLCGYGKLIVLFLVCMLFGICARLNGEITYEQHILSAISDHYYLSYFLLPMALLSCFSFIEDDAELVILRFQSYRSYFLKKWIGVGFIAVVMIVVQTGAVLVSGIGLFFKNEWPFAVGTAQTDLFLVLEPIFSAPLQAFVCFTVYQIFGIWWIFGICMWIRHFCERKWTIRIVVILYVLSALWIKLSAIQKIPFTGFNHLLIFHHNLGGPYRFKITVLTLLLLGLIISASVQFAWRLSLQPIQPGYSGITGYYLRMILLPRNLIILAGVVSAVTLYKGLSNGAGASGVEWVHSLFAGHGIGYFQVLPFLEMLITSGTPLYLLAVFVEQSVNGQALFVSIRGKSRKHLFKGILTVSANFLMVYALFWLVAGVLGAVLFRSSFTMLSFVFLLYAVLMKCFDIFVQYLIMFGIYIVSRQITAGFLILLAGNLICIFPGNWVQYLPLGLSSLTRISVMEHGMGPSAAAALGVEAAVLVLMLTGVLMLGCKKY